MRAYQIDEQRPRFYRVPLLWAPSAIRPNRTAAGMSYTRGRKGDPHAPIKKPTVLKLLVHGTADDLAGLRYGMRVAPKPCPCCGKKTGRLALNDSGRLRLNHLRRAARPALIHRKFALIDALARRPALRLVEAPAC